MPLMVLVELFAYQKALLSPGGVALLSPGGVALLSPGGVALLSPGGMLMLLAEALT